MILKKVVGTLKYGGWRDVLVHLGHNLKGDCGITALFPFSLLPGHEANSFLCYTHTQATSRNIKAIGHCLWIETINPVGQSEPFCFLSYLLYFVMATGADKFPMYYVHPTHTLEVKSISSQALQTHNLGREWNTLQVASLGFLCCLGKLSHLPC